MHIIIVEKEHHLYARLDSYLVAALLTAAKEAQTTKMDLKCVQFTVGTVLSILDIKTHKAIRLSQNSRI